MWRGGILCCLDTPLARCSLLLRNDCCQQASLILPRFCMREGKCPGITLGHSPEGLYDTCMTNTGLRVFSGSGISICSTRSHYYLVQLREQAAWFWSAPEGGPSAEEIRVWMGNLGSIRCVARYTARMGQCFSTTYDTLRMEVRPCIPSLEEHNVDTVTETLCP